MAMEKLLPVLTIYGMSCSVGKSECGTLQAWSYSVELNASTAIVTCQKVTHAKCEVLVLQEVRLHADRSGSQADLLQQLLPQFRWVETRLADRVTKPAHSYWAGWEMEGLAVLSKLPIGTVRVEKLSKVHGPDTNQRIALHVPITVDLQTSVNILVVHLSYHRQQQCQNAAEILHYIDKNRLTNVVVAGDFNAYPDFLDPIRLFQTGERQAGDDGNQCEVILMSPLSSAIAHFQDVWEVTHNNSPGFTFSNMPEPGLTSRPDRILASSSLRVVQTSLYGHDITYKATRSPDIFIHRLHRVIATAKDALHERSGYSCFQDCGPHGSCRCGVCVKRGERESCDLPHCEECSSGVFLQLCGFFSIIVILGGLAGAATVKILVVAARIDQTGASPLPGCACCLCNPQLIRQPTLSGRRGVGRVLRCMGVGRLPPAFLLLLSLTLIMCLSGIGALVFKPLLDTAANVMPEEYFPSDHLMIAAKLQIK